MVASSDAHAMRIGKTVMAAGDKTGGLKVSLATSGLGMQKMRIPQFDAAGREMAGWFAKQRQIKRVLHPVFESCPRHGNWKADFTGASRLFGVVFHPCDDAQICAFVDGLHHFSIGVSWGGYESLVLPVKPQRNAGTWDEDGQLVRFYIGLKDLHTLKANLAENLIYLNTVKG